MTERAATAADLRAVELPMKSLSFELRPVPPFRLDYTAWALRRRTHNTVDLCDGISWRRVLVIDNAPLETALTQLGTSERHRLKVTLTGNRISEHAKEHASRLLRQMFGLTTDLSLPSIILPPATGVWHRWPSASAG